MKAANAEDEFWDLVNDRCMPAITEGRAPDTRRLRSMKASDGSTIWESKHGGAALSWKQLRDGLFGCDVYLDPSKATSEVLDEMQRAWDARIVEFQNSGRFTTINDCQVDGFDYYRAIGSTTTTQSGKYMAVIFFVTEQQIVLTAVLANELPAPVCARDPSSNTPDP